MSCPDQSSSEPIPAEARNVSAESSWFAVQTRPRHEKKAAAELHAKGIKTLLPLHAASRQWSDRRRLVHAPIFSGYVFVSVANSVDARVAVLRTNGVRSFVGVRGTGIAIPEHEIEAIQAIIEQGVQVDPHPFLKIGQRVRICGGSLDGVEGILQDRNRHPSLVISVELIQRSLAIRVAGYRIEPVGSQPQN
jgi:transcription antitermination factor NusG